MVKASCAGFEKKAFFERVLDGRKQPIRGLWRRGGKFYARLTVQDESGNKLEKRIPLTAQNVRIPGMKCCVSN